MNIDSNLVYMAGALVAGLGPLVWWHVKKGRAEAAWDPALEELAGIWGLKQHVAPQFMDTATGDVAGLALTLCPHAGDDGPGELPRMYMDLQVSNRDHDSELKAWRHGTTPCDTFNDPLEAEKPTPLGVPNFDQHVFLADASTAELAALRDNPYLRDHLIRVIGQGGYVHGDEVQLRRDTFVKSTEELKQLLIPMMELSKWLQAPTGAKPTLSLP